MKKINPLLIRYTFYTNNNNEEDNVEITNENDNNILVEDIEKKMYIL